MPRDLRSPEIGDDAAAPRIELTASPDDEVRSNDSKAIDGNGYNEFTIHRGLEQHGFGNLRNAQAGVKNMEDLHPYVQTLSLANLESCVALENATFPTHERCSEEKVKMRLFYYRVLFLLGRWLCFLLRVFRELPGALPMGACYPSGSIKVKKQAADSARSSHTA
ncbi:MAG: hypothetical protein Q9220_005924 [cf. Caloplaca sp. 1 TL-2023]